MVRRVRAARLSVLIAHSCVAAPAFAEEDLAAPALPEQSAPEQPALPLLPKTWVLDYSVWGRVGGELSNGAALDDASVNGLFAFNFSGQVHPYIKFMASLIAEFGSGVVEKVGLLDGSIQFELAPVFNVWVGRMIVPADRSHFSGPWFMAPWNYPGLVPSGLLAAPRSGAFGRGNGVTVWGQYAGGIFKYYLSATDLHDRSQSPLFTARLNMNFLSPEPGYYHASSYYGKDVLAVGVAAQYKNNGSVGEPPDEMSRAPFDDYAAILADLLFERRLGSAGVLDIEGAFYKYWGDFEPVDWHWFALASYLIGSAVGPGKLQPLIRVQQIHPTFPGGSLILIDSQIGYVINGSATWLALGYRHESARAQGTGTQNGIFAGVQVQR